MAEEEGTTTAEWASSVEDEGLRGTLGQYESQEAFFNAAGIEAPKAPDPVDWRTGLDGDLSKVAERFNSPTDAMRSIVALQKRDGQVRVPGKDATDEERASYRKAVGIPDKPDAYEFPEIEDMTDEIKSSREQWSSRFHELDVPSETAKKLIQMVGDDNAAQLKAQEEADKAFADSQDSALKEEWKSDYDKNTIIANRAFSAMADKAGLKLDDLTRIETKDGRLLMDRAEIVKLFSIVGREMEEGSLGHVITDGERETLDDQVRDIRKQISEAQSEGDSKRANKLYTKEQALIAKMNGGQPIVGSQGRSA